MPTEPRFGDMWAYDRWTLMFIWGDRDTDTSYWLWVRHEGMVGDFLDVKPLASFRGADGLGWRKLS